MRLKDVSIINPKNKADDNTEAGFIPMPLISKNYLESVMFQKKTWNEIKKGFTHFQNNDVVVAKITPCFENSKAAIISNLPNNLGAGTTELHVIRPIKILPEYVYAIAKTKQFLESGKQEMTGCAGQQRVPTSFIEDYLIPIPPINEQQRITQTIKELLNLVETLENDKVNLSELIKQTKAKVLDLAIKGKLVPQDPNDEPADKLLEKIRGEKEKLIKEGKLKRDKNETYIFKNSDDNSYYEQIDGETICIDDDLPFEIPDSWRVAKINSIAFVTKLAGFEYTKYIANNLCSEGVPLFKGKNIQDGEIIYKFEHYIPNKVSDNLVRSQINKKCILLPYVGTIGNVAIHNKKGKFHLGSNVGKIELFNSLNINILEEYVLYFLRSSIGKIELTKHKKATAQDSISIDAIRDVNMLIPPIQEQNRIVKKIKSIFNQLDTMQEIFHQ